MSLTFILIGLLTGAITGITGASGVLVIVPILTMFTDLPLHAILGTSLLVDVIASIAVSYAYMRNKHVEAGKALWLLVGALIGAQAGSFFVLGFSKLFIIIVLAVCMLFFGINMLRSGVSKKIPKFITIPENYAIYLRKPLPMIILGLFVGFATGVFGAGGGITIFIILFSLLRLPIKTAVGTSTFVMLVTALSGVIGYMEYNGLNLQTGLIMGVAAAIGGAISARFANHIEDHILARWIGGFFIFLSAVMIVLKAVMPMTQ